MLLIDYDAFRKLILTKDLKLYNDCGGLEHFIKVPLNSLGHRYISRCVVGLCRLSNRG